MRARELRFLSMLGCPRQASKTLRSKNFDRDLELLTLGGPELDASRHRSVDGELFSLGVVRCCGLKFLHVRTCRKNAQNRIS